MRIELTNGYHIEVDYLNFTLKQRYVSVNKKTKEQKESARTIGYYSKLEDALMGFVKRNQIDEIGSQSIDFPTYIKMIEEINKAAIQAIMSVVGEE